MILEICTFHLFTIWVVTFYRFKLHVPSLTSLVEDGSELSVNINHTSSQFLNLSSKLDTLDFEILHNEKRISKKHFRKSEFLKEWHLMLLRVQRLCYFIDNGEEPSSLDRNQDIVGIVGEAHLKYTAETPLKELLLNPVPVL